MDDLINGDISQQAAKKALDIVDNQIPENFLERTLPAYFSQRKMNARRVGRTF